MPLSARALVFATLFIAGCGSSSTTAPPKAGSLDVTTDKGPVHGSTDGVSRSFLYMEIKAGRLASVKLGSRRLILREDLVTFLGSLKAAR